MAGAVAVSRSVATALVAGGAIAVLRTFGSCSAPSEPAGAATDAAADQAGDSDASPPDSPPDAPADHAAPPWDPVWHETKPASFQVVPPGPRRAKGCGPACKVIAETTPEGTAERRPRADDGWAVSQVVPGGRVHAVRLATGTEYAVDDGKGWGEGVGAGGAPSVSKDLIFYGVTTWWGVMMILRSLNTGEAKVVWAREGDGGTMTTSFSDPYLYWAHGPPELLYRFDVRNGAIKSVPDGGCIVLEGASNGLATCAGEGFVDLIDFDSGSTKKLSKSAFADIAGSISPDGKSAAWIDTRDPAANGKRSTWLDPHGGEVYTKDLLTGVETRVTWDSPAAPAIKSFPRFVAGRLVWQSWVGWDGGGTQSQDLWKTASQPWYAVDGGTPASLAAMERRVTYPQPVSSGVVATLYQFAGGPPGESLLVLLEWPTGATGG